MVEPIPVVMTLDGAGRNAAPQGVQEETGMMQGRRAGIVIGSTACAAAIMLAGAAFAAEPIDYGLSTGVEGLPVHDMPLVDWDGFYAGVYAGGTATVGDTGVPAGTDLTVGLALGANQVFNFFLVGAEVAVQTGLGGDEAVIEGQVLGRGGILVTDDLLAYGAAGYGSELGTPGNDHLLLGGGVEVSVTEGVSLRGQYLYGHALSAPTAEHQISFGANFHF